MTRILTADLSDSPTQTKLLTRIAEISAGSQQRGNNMADDTDKRKKTQRGKKNEETKERKGKRKQRQKNGRQRHLLDGVTNIRVFT
jgi:hypothetical protein